MSNKEILKDYLVAEKGYLKSDISNGKVIMLSGKWGSGKTHFWQNEIATDDLKKELHKKREIYSYISLYGKSSIEEIENDIFSQAYASSIGGENFITKGFSTFTKRMARFGSSKIASGLKEEQNDNIERIALARLNNGGIICFDDFERKSKDIDLNDLFGFITQLTINFNCKVVIILNDDVFDGDEKDVFSNVKEKTVSKFLKYEPNIKDLFNSIFNNEKYKKLDNYKEVILKTIEETKELNARIYIQVLDNLSEWIDKKQEVGNDILRCLILVNINFILYHTILIRELKNKGADEFYLYKIEKLILHDYNYFTNNTVGISSNLEPTSFDNYINKIKKKKFDSKDMSDEKIRINNKFIEDNETLFRSDYFANKLSISKGISDEIFQKINKFIETGILINE